MPFFVPNTVLPQHLLARMSIHHLTAKLSPAGGGCLMEAILCAMGTTEVVSTREYK